MVFKLSNTFTQPTAPANAQRGFPAPGAGAQTTDPNVRSPDMTATPWVPNRPTKGVRTWFKPSSAQSEQRGFPAPQNAAQRRPAGSMPNVPPLSGMPTAVWTPYYDRGSAAWVQNFGKVLVNPIGAGIVALNRPQASYGMSSQYENGALWWTSQVIPTSINPQGLSDPQELAALLGSLNVQAVVRTTG